MARRHFAEIILLTVIGVWGCTETAATHRQSPRPTDLDTIAGDPAYASDTNVGDALASDDVGPVDRDVAGDDDAADAESNPGDGDLISGDVLAGADEAGQAGDATVEVGDSHEPICIPLAGLGVLDCPCNSLDASVWEATAPYLSADAIDFGQAGFVSSQLTAGGATILAEGTLGGSSIESEVTAFEVLARCEGAVLLKSESKIHYQDAGGKKADILVSIDGLKIGVSVARAYHYPPTTPYTAAEAQTLLSRKLSDLTLSQANAVTADAWIRSVLHIIAYDPQYAETIQSTWAGLDAATRGDKILFVTTTNGDDSAIY